MHEKYENMHGKCVYKLGPASQRAAGAFFPEENTFPGFLTCLGNFFVIFSCIFHVFSVFSCIFHAFLMFFMHFSYIFMHFHVFFYDFVDFSGICPIDCRAVRIREGKASLYPQTLPPEVYYVSFQTGQ